MLQGNPECALSFFAYMSPFYAHPPRSGLGYSDLPCGNIPPVLQHFLRRFLFSGNTSYTSHLLLRWACLMYTPLSLGQFFRIVWRTRREWPVFALQKHHSRQSHCIPAPSCAQAGWVPFGCLVSRRAVWRWTCWNPIAGITGSGGPATPGLSGDSQGAAAGFFLLLRGEWFRKGQCLDRTHSLVARLASIHGTETAVLDMGHGECPLPCRED